VKDRLVAIVSHEFRTPLASITGLSRTLAARNDDLDRETVQACLAGIDHHARRLARLVHNVGAASGDVDVNQTVATDLSAITRAAVAEALEAHRNRTRVRLDVPTRLEAGVSPLAARRILGNLCDNAVKFAPAGALVEVSGTHEADAVVLEVGNETEAMCPRTLERCFEPFVQADSSDTRPGEGMGLGLHVARRLARAHGGDLCARLREGHVVFRLRLPLPGPLAVEVLKDASRLVASDAAPTVGAGSDGSHRRS
jgi:signal transduction histidine kinase